MAYERLRNSGLTQALGDLFADLGDLVQKEIQLAKAVLPTSPTAEFFSGRRRDEFELTKMP